VRTLTLVLGICLLAVGLVVLSMPDEAWCRAGGGFSGGSRGSRTYSGPSRSYSLPARPSSPSPAPAPQPSTSPSQSSPSPTGGFWRSMAGGALGGILGGMLFRGMGFAGGAEGFGGGFGFMDLLLLGGIAYLIYWMVKRGRRSEEATAGGYYGRMSAEPYAGAEPSVATMEAPAPAGAGELERGLSHIRQMDPHFDEAAFKEWCSDTFFRIQAAWMHRDLDRLRPALAEEMLQVFRTQLEALRTKRQINTLENIAIRSIELTEAWQEQGQDYITVRYLANLLDYTVDEATGKVVEGSDREPVKFEEYWTWVRPVGPNPWRLSAIQQAG
jgi:predicted lipid-binding transport protein (Tim44 family)